MDRKKELKNQYLSTRPEMGVFRIACTASGSCYLFASGNMKSLMNRYRFQLSVGSHPNAALQKEWRELGADSFSMEVLEVLEYDKQERRGGYDEDLELLRQIWRERLGPAASA